MGNDLTTLVQHDILAWDDISARCPDSVPQAMVDAYSFYLDERMQLDQTYAKKRSDVLRDRVFYAMLGAAVFGNLLGMFGAIYVTNLFFVRPESVLAAAVGWSIYAASIFLGGALGGGIDRFLDQGRQKRLHNLACEEREQQREINARYTRLLALGEADE